MFGRKLELNNFTDIQLVEMYKAKHDSQILAELYTRYSHLIYSVCYKYLKNEEDSRDAVMEIWEQLQKTIARHEIKSFKSWIYAVTRNYCLLVIRRDQYQPLTVAEPYEEMEKKYGRMENDEFMHLLNRLDKDSTEDRLEAAISKLTEAQQECLRLFYFEGKKYKEIMELTGFSMMQVKSNLQNAKRNLKKILEQEGV